MFPVKKHLSLQPLIDGFKSAFGDPADSRRKKSVQYTLLDAALSGLACMFYQSKNMLRFQEMLKQKYHRNNLETQFGVVNTPKDNQMRALIGAIDSEQFRPIFKNYQNRLQRSKHLAQYLFQGKYLTAMDASTYYQSDKISCSCCLTKEKRNGAIEYSHQALQPIICHPDQKLILPLMPEAIENTDGQTKQDCEINAAKRLLPKIRSQHPRMSHIWLADSLYATAPFIQEILDHQEDFIFRVKQGDHPYLFKHLETADYQSHRVSQGKSTLAMRWYHNVPLNGRTEITVAVIKTFVITTDKQGNKKSTIAGIWITNLDVNEKTITSITRAARARWKVENACFNTVKNQGYALTHNWGHVNGEAFNFYILVMLAFYIHQILEMTDQLFQWCKKMSRTYKELWVELELLFRWFVFDSWEQLLCSYLQRNEHSPPDII
jgi:hypothetical protein